MAGMRKMRGKWYIRVFVNRRERLIPTNTTNQDEALIVKKKVEEQEHLLKQKLIKEMDFPSNQLDKAIKDFQLHEMGATETHWKDLIVSNLEQQLVELQHPTNDLSRAEQVEAEQRIAMDIYLTFEKRSERIEKWKERTEKSQAAFYRRIRELKTEGRLP